MNTFITVWIISVLLSFFVSGILYAFNVVDGKFVVLCTALPPVLVIAIILLIAFSFTNYVLNMNTNFKNVFNKAKDAFLSFLGVCFFISLFALMFYGISHDANKLRKNESYVGKQVVIDGDTTTITNFSRGGWGVPYGLNLSNGGILSPDAVEQFIIE